MILSGKANYLSYQVEHKMFTYLQCIQPFAIQVNGETDKVAVLRHNLCRAKFFIQRNTNYE